MHEKQTTINELIDVIEDEIPTQQVESSDNNFRELEYEVNQKDSIIIELENEDSKKEDGIQDMEAKINDLKIQVTKLCIDVEGDPLKFYGSLLGSKFHKFSCFHEDWKTYK